MRRNWMPLYIPDFLADTMHLSAAETGAYLCLIMDYWLHDGLPDDDDKLAKIARVPGKTWRRMRPTIAAFFCQNWRHKRIDSELEKMVGITERRHLAAVKAGTMSAIKREMTRQNANGGNSTSRQRHVNETSTSGARRVNHTTQEDITTTFTAAAREGSPEGDAAPPRDKTPTVATDELGQIIQKRGWVRPC